MIPDETLRQETLKRITDGLQWQGKTFAISAIRKEGTQALCYALMDCIDTLSSSQ